MGFTITNSLGKEVGIEELAMGVWHAGKRLEKDVLIRRIITGGAVMLSHLDSAEGPAVSYLNCYDVRKFLVFNPREVGKFDISVALR